MNERKLEWMAMVCHDIRTPLTSIMGYAGLLEHNAASPERTVYYAEKILRAAEAMCQMTNDLMEAGRPGPSWDRCSPMTVSRFRETMLQEALEPALNLMAEKHISFTCDITENPAQVACNWRHLTQVLVNLLSNSAKYTDPGGHVNLTVRLEEARLIIQVRDNGRGMTQEFLETIFRPYSREEAGPGQPEGKGLGMAIVKLLVDHMEGTIEIQSRPARGTCVTVTVPARPLPYKKGC